MLHSNPSSQTLTIPAGESRQMVFVYHQSVDRVSAQTIILEQGSNMELLVIVVGSQSDELPIHLDIQHGAYSTSRIDIRAVLRDSASHKIGRAHV